LVRIQPPQPEIKGDVMTEEELKAYIKDNLNIKASIVRNKKIPGTLSESDFLTISVNLKDEKVSETEIDFRQLFGRY
jgi:hypothetical protein